MDFPPKRVCRFPAPASADARVETSLFRCYARSIISTFAAVESEHDIPPSPVGLVITRARQSGVGAAFLARIPVSRRTARNFCLVLPPHPPPVYSAELESPQVAGVGSTHLSHFMNVSSDLGDLIWEAVVRASGAACVFLRHQKQQLKSQESGF